MRTLALVLATLAANAPPSATPVSVAYAASLTAVVQGPLAQALRSEKRLVLQGEGKGSRALAHLIADGVRTPDAFVTADVSLYPTLRDSRGSMIREAWILGSARLLLGCSKSSPKSAAIDRLARGAPILATLDSAGIRLGRTDPRVDPKGSRTVEAFDLLAKHEGDESAEKRLLANARVFPEEVLLARVEQGELDCAVF
jgi:molybdate/tungstate transport system substrate-binding protein